MHLLEKVGKISWFILIFFILVHQIVLYNAINELNFNLLYLEYIDAVLSEIVYFFHLFLIGNTIYNSFKKKKIKYFFSLVVYILVIGLYFHVQYYYDQAAIDKFTERQKLDHEMLTNGD